MQKPKSLSICILFMFSFLPIAVSMRCLWEYASEAYDILKEREDSRSTSRKNALWDMQSILERRRHEFDQCFSPEIPSAKFRKTEPPIAPAINQTKEEYKHEDVTDEKHRMFNWTMPNVEDCYSYKTIRKVLIKWSWPDQAKVLSICSLVAKLAILVSLLVGVIILIIDVVNILALPSWSTTIDFKRPIIAHIFFNVFLFLWNLMKSIWNLVFAGLQIILKPSEWNIYTRYPIEEVENDKIVAYSSDDELHAFPTLRYAYEGPASYSASSILETLQNLKKELIKSSKMSTDESQLLLPEDFLQKLADHISDDESLRINLPLMSPSSLLELGKFNREIMESQLALWNSGDRQEQEIKVNIGLTMDEEQKKKWR